MKTLKTFLATFAKGKHLHMTVGLILVALLQAPLAGRAQQSLSDISVSSEIKKQLFDPGTTKSLFFPKSVSTFYASNNYQPVWINSRVYSKQTGEAMMLLDCVLQYGLSHKDYHPNELTYDVLRDISEKPASVSLGKKARFELLLTDALLTLMNNMHFGKLNPYCSAEKIDIGIAGFSAPDSLSLALKSKLFMRTIENAQPRVKAYRDLQDHMRQLEGVYKEDCYVTPEADVRKMAINMERIRWGSFDENTYIQINIPTYALLLKLPDTSYKFKVIVGKSETPTPTLLSAVTYFTTAPEWRVPKSIFTKEILPKAIKDSAFLENNHYAIYDHQGNFLEPTHGQLIEAGKHPSLFYARQSAGCDNSLGLIVFRFQNIYDVYLHDTPEQKLFKGNERAFSHGCIRVEQAKELAALLLTADGAKDQIKPMRNAIAAYQTKDFKLHTQIPIKITYLTCEMNEGELILHPDIYDLDKSLELALYGGNETLTNR